MNSTNTLLLSIINRNERYGQDVESLRRRYQCLSLIYVNLGLTALIIIFNLIDGLYLKNPTHFLMILVCIPLSLLSFFFLKMKNLTISTLALLLEMHMSNVVSSYAMNYPFVGIYGILMYPFFIFSLTSSMRIHFLNIVLCGIEYYVNTKQISQIFEVALTLEQTRQINILIPTGLFCSITAIGILTLQKFVELDIWKIAQENYIKSENLTKDVVQAMEAKDTFVSMLSHEIRNPLNSLKGSIDYLLQVMKEYEYIQVLKNAKMSGDILLNLVSNVLDAAKLKSDKMEIANMETDLIDIVKKVYSINSEKFKEKELFARAFIDESVPRLLWVDPSRILQILMNLVSNSVKFTPKGGKINIYASWCQYKNDNNYLLTCFPNINLDGFPIMRTQQRTLEPRSKLGNFFIQKDNSAYFEEFKIEERYKYHQNLMLVPRSFNQCTNDLSKMSIDCCHLAGEWWSLHRTFFLNQIEEYSCLANNNNENMNKGILKIQITDTGCGIDQDELPKMFGMFQQTTSGARSVDGGTGLGLWICKQLCSKMKGDITVYSKKGIGSSFVLYIPIDNNPVSMTIIPRLTLMTKKVKVLVVDDYSVNRYIHKLFLEQEGAEVTVACDGKEAVDKYEVHQGDYDFIMMDIQMPVMDGFTAAKLIREWEVKYNQKKVDIYFVTGEYFSEEEILSGFRNIGGSGDGIKCLRKPLSGDVVKKIVEHYKILPQ